MAYKSEGQYESGARGILEFTDIIVLEGDYYDKDISYFTGIKSVGEQENGNHNIEIKTKNKNLIDQNLIIGDIGTDLGELRLGVDTHAITKEFIKCKGNTNYSLSYTPIGTSKWFAIFEYDGNYNLIKKNDLHKNFRTDEKTKYLRFKIENAENINITDLQLEENIVATSYEISQSNISRISLNEPLRGIEGGAKDRIIKKNGQWMIERNIAQIKLDGRNQFDYSLTGSNSDILNIRSDVINTKRDSKSISNILPNSSIPLYSNTDSSTLYTSYFTGYADNKLIRIFIDGITTLDGYKQYLSNNPVEIIYELATPVYESIKIDLSINLFEGTTHILNNSNIPATIEVTVDRTLNRAVEYSELAKTNPTINNLSKARYWNNLLKDSIKKDQLQEEVNNITRLNDMELERKTATSNLDLYIKCENILMMSLSTNNITFEDFSGVEDMTKENAVQISINSSLPYSLNAYLPTEIQNSDKLATMNKDILNIKENSESAYQTFINTTDKIILKDNNQAGNDLIHNIDIKLKGGIAHQKDVYKTTIKFEAEQK